MIIRQFENYFPKYFVFLLLNGSQNNATFLCVFELYFTVFTYNTPALFMRFSNTV